MVIEKYGRLLFPYSSGTLYLIDPSHEYFDHRISWNQPEATDDIFLHEDCWALRIGAFYQVSDPAHDLVCKHFRKEQTSRYFCLPLTAQSETIGLLCIEHNLQNEHDRHIVLSDDSRRMLAVRMSDQIALSIANIKLRETLRIQSTRDPLTGLFNRRYLAEVMRRELPRAERKDVQLGVILIDIDFFKKFNDTYGHDTGDLVLTSLADIFTRVTRKTDIVSRLGGEEFLIILRDTTKAKLLSYLENLQAEVRKLDLHYAGRSVGKITFSAGVSMFPEHGNYMESLVNAADGALYKAKEAGRNRFVFAVDEQIVKEKG